MALPNIAKVFIMYITLLPCLIKLELLMYNFFRASLHNSNITLWFCPIQLRPLLYNYLKIFLYNSYITSWLYSK